MERWEPPRRTRRSEPSRARSARRRRASAGLWSDLAPVAIVRLAIGVMFVVAATTDGARSWLLVAGVLSVVALAALSFLGPRLGWGGPLARRVWVSDGAALGLIIPLAMINLFAAAGEGSLLGIERSVYLQTGFIVAVALLLLGGVSAWNVGPWVVSAGVIPLPAVLAIPVLAGTYADLRSSTAAEALAVLWIVAAAGTFVVPLVGRSVRAGVPLAIYAGVVVWKLTTVPQVLTLGGESGLVSGFHPVLVIWAGLALLAGPLTPAILQSINPRGTPQRRGRGSRYPL